MKRVTLTNLKTHIAGWILYSIICYFTDRISGLNITYIELLSTLPLPMLVFYWARAWARWFDSDTYRWLAIIVVLVAALPFITLCYLVVYKLLPVVGIYIPHTLVVTWQELMAGLLPEYMRFTAYGTISYYVGKSAYYRRLEGKLLAVQLTPHTVYNMCAGIAETVTAGNEKARRYLKGYMGLMDYSVRVPELSKDLVPLDHEQTKLEAWLDTCGEQASMKVEGDTSRHVLPPFTLITLVENALKYRMPGTFVHLYILCKERSLKVRCVNILSGDTAKSGGLGVALKNLGKRLDLLRADGIKTSLRTGAHKNTYVVELELYALKNEPRLKNT